MKTKHNTNKVFALIQKDVLLELRQQYTLYGVLLYIASTIFVVYLMNEQPETKVWNSLFWVVQLFVCINAVAKSFLQENKGRLLYFYTIAGAKDFIVAKLCFNMLLMLAMNLLSIVIFVALLGNPIQSIFYFVALSSLGGIGLSLIFTFLAAIASKAQQQAALMAIMGFPLVIPQLLLLARLADIAFATVIQNSFWQMCGLLIGLDVMVFFLALILFPYLWRD